MVGNRACTIAGVEVRERQKHRPPGARQLADDAARHDVARREIAGRLVARS